MNVGIIGHNGFIGKNLVQYLRNCDYRENIDLYKYNIFDFLKLQEFCENKDVIVHLAALNRGNEDNIYFCNYWGFYNVFSLCRKNRIKLIYPGTTYIGECAYKKSKDKISFLMQKFGTRSNFDCVELKLPKVFGCGCLPFYNSFITTMIYSFAKNKEYKHLIKDYNEVLELVYIDDVCREIYNILLKDFKKYNLVEFNENNGLLKLSIGDIIFILENDYRVLTNMFKSDIILLLKNAVEYYRSFNV